jgi:hypothetical protein
MNPKIESIKIFDEGVDVVYRQSSDIMLLTNPPQIPPDIVWREEWRIIRGKLRLDKKNENNHTAKRSL